MSRTLTESQARDARRRATRSRPTSNPNTSRPRAISGGGASAYNQKPSSSVRGTTARRAR